MVANPELTMDTKLGRPKRAFPTASTWREGGGLWSEAWKLRGAPREVLQLRPVSPSMWQCAAPGMPVLGRP
jgi:hypothetical protein